MKRATLVARKAVAIIGETFKHPLKWSKIVVTPTGTSVTTYDGYQSMKKNITRSRKTKKKIQK